MEMLLYVQDYVNFFSRSGYYALQQAVGKVPIPSRKEKVSQQGVLSCGSCITVEITSFCFLRTKFETGLENWRVEEDG